jgi:FKBP-type peptidyl-prolyl cis-trans isomerase
LIFSVRYFRSPGAWPAALQVNTTQQGDGSNFPKPGQTVTVHYTGRLISNGKKFDSSVDRGQPFKFKIGVGQVIRGWDEGVAQMSIGQKATLRIPAAMGTGSTPIQSNFIFDSCLNDNIFCFPTQSYFSFIAFVELV